ncbi:inositol monophosphatase [Notoacmeibacter marinus]|uniref:Inositol monophosphatase n=1 Tax=Notoacmeibacter marinus TaxID=1876515 RepID=A0A231UZZ4_9HYPH|nr:inositol monophosphatase [Notoacmeibacter marinus]
MTFQEESLATNAQSQESEQLLHLVFGGELESLDGLTFRDIDKLDIVGIFPNFATAEKAWRKKAQQTVDNAHMRYFIVHMHRFLSPGQD